MGDGQHGNRRRHLVFIGGTSEPGGIHIHMADVAQACADLGYRVTIVCTSADFFSGLISDGRVKIIRVEPLEGQAPRVWLATWFRILRTGLGGDFILCRGRFAETRLVDMAAARLFGRRLYTIEHRPWEGAWRSHLPRAVFGRLSSLLTHRSIAVSSEIVDAACREFSYPRRKLALCQNWIAPSFRPPSADERTAARAAAKVPPGRLVVGYIGRLAPEKRVDALLRAFERLPRGLDALLLIGGDGWKRRSLVELAAELGVSDRVRFTGWTSDPRSFLAACDVVVLPSLVEGFPLALMEALAIGRLCIAHPMASTRELIEHGHSGVLADLEDPGQFTAALLAGLEAGQEDREAMGARAAETLASRFSRERRLPALLAALDCPVGSGGAPPMRARELSFEARWRCLRSAW